MRVLVTAALASLLALSGTAIFGSALSGPAYAAASAVVIDARSGSVLHADNADTRQNAPALPKLMTIYLMFEAFEAGTVKPETNIFVSGTAIRQPQPTLGLNHFDTISAGDALNALVTVNANDAAAVLAEFLAGSEERFVAKMNARAKELGLTQTRFANISGAPHPQQFSTPRDMILFSLALMRTHPERAKGLVGTSFAWKGRTYQGPQSFLSALSGNSSANLGGTQQAPTVNRAKSTRSGDRDVIAVVWNANSPEDADRMIVASLTAAQAGKAVPAPAVTAPTPAGGTFVAGNWGIQLGAFSTEAAARAQLTAALQTAPELAQANLVVSPLSRPSGTLYRAQYKGVDETTARRICTAIKGAGAACIPLSR
jgi:D-alanyl-D-alanine carboxypeptidase